MEEAKDILQIVHEDDILKLTKMYKNNLPITLIPYNFLKTAMNWRKKCPDKNYITIMVPYGKCQEDGMFVALMKFGCYDLFLYTLEESCTNLIRAISELKTINWNTRIVWVTIQDNCSIHAVKFLQEIDYPVREHIFHTWWLPKEKALLFDVNCPLDLFIDKLDKSHVSIMNAVWPHRYDGSIEFLTTLVEMGGGVGLFKKNGNKLVAWILKNHTGSLGVLQTIEAHQRKGYGTIVTKVMSKKIAREGLDPYGTVLHFNTGSQNLFAKLGFKNIGTVKSIEGLKPLL